jgi:hypothetical protein
LGTIIEAIDNRLREVKAWHAVLEPEKAQGKTEAAFSQLGVPRVDLGSQ